MTEREYRVTKIKDEPIEEDDEYERVECKVKRKPKFMVKIEPVDFEFLNNFKVDSDNEDSIDAILEKKKAEEQLPFVTINNLRNLVIRLRHDVPSQHQVERSAGSHVLSPAEREAFEALVPKNQIKRGVYTPAEDQLIIDNWKAFCHIHNWDETNPKPFLYMRHNGTFYLKRESERKKFVQFLADGLPRRTLYSVYHRFRILYDIPKATTKYSHQEDEYIINHIERNKNVDKTRMFADLAKVLNRSRASVWRRYRLLKKKQRNDD